MKNIIIYGLTKIGKTSTIIKILNENYIKFEKINCIHYNLPHLLVPKISKIFQKIIKEDDFKVSHKVIYY